MRNKFLKLSFLTAAIIFSLCLSAFDATAQTSKRRKKVRRVKKTAVVNPQPVQTTTAQNPPYVDGNQIVLGELPTAPPDETVGTANDQTLTPVLPDDKDTQIRQLGDRIKLLESVNGKEAKQKQLLMNLDILTRAESRSESLRKQLYEIIEKENATQARLQQIQIESRSEVIDRNVALSGSLRPEELRDQRRKSLEAEKLNLESLLTQIQSNRTNLESIMQKSDALVEKIRTKLDKEIDDALTDSSNP